MNKLQSFWLAILLSSWKELCTGQNMQSPCIHLVDVKFWYLLTMAFPMPGTFLILEKQLMGR